ncbi:MAG: DUF4301 family protein [Alphaproteobacteria bacterium]
MDNLSNSDITQITLHGLTLDDIKQQLDNFINGFPYANIIKPATINDGITRLTPQTEQKYLDIYNANINNKSITKFVPASGAATRMFKDLFEYLSNSQSNETTDKVLQNINKFAFYDKLKKHLPPHPTNREIISAIVSKAGLNYGNLPKALIIFHKTNNTEITACEEHLIEGALYTKSNGIVNIHFTISPEHKTEFYNLINHVIPIYEKQFNVKYNITTSEQNPATDTIAVSETNEIFRTSDKKILFRPSGHGALIENLNSIESDIIFIKNIDNVCNKENQPDTIKYKQILGGILIDTQNQIFKYINDLEKDTYNIDEICNFITNNLGTRITQKNKKTLINILNRPLRVCGVVKNTGAPGGGPFWVHDNKYNSESLQIIESSQIAPESRNLMEQSTHFNPVDIVCGVYDYQHNKFDLTRYIDKNSGFISEKSDNGKKLRAMERPGLWNGAMAYWNTIFIEVPNTTFTPVKKVSDLLTKAHI